MPSHLSWEDDRSRRRAALLGRDVAPNASYALVRRSTDAITHPVRVSPFVGSAMLTCVLTAPGCGRVESVAVNARDATDDVTGDATSAHPRDAEANDAPRDGTLQDASPESDSSRPPSSDGMSAVDGSVDVGVADVAASDARTCTAPDPHLYLGAPIIPPYAAAGIDLLGGPLHDGSEGWDPSNPSAFHYDLTKEGATPR